MIPTALSRLSCIGVLSALLSACNTLPTVTYYQINTSDDAAKNAVTDSYYLAQSQIVIDKTRRENDKTKAMTEDYSVASKPVAFKTYKIGVKAHNSILRNTKINVTKIDNTDLVSSLGIETTDNAATFVTQLGGVITKIIALAPGAKACIPDDNFPVALTIDASLLKEASASTLEFDGSGTNAAGGCISVAIAAPPTDAVTSYPFKQGTSDYYYAACRDATVTFTQGGKKISKDVRISDPNRFQFVQMPYKGSITSHSQCGVSVKTEANSPQNALGILDAMASQLKAIKDAVNAK